MATMVLMDFIVMRKPIAQLALTSLFVSLFLGAVSIAAFFPFIFVMSLLTVDEQNGWERFRLTMPVTRNQVVRGRYLTALLAAALSAVAATALAVPFSWLAQMGLPVAPLFSEEGVSGAELLPTAAASACAAALAILVLLSISLPIYMRFGATKAARMAPAIVVLVFCGGMAALGQIGVLDQWGPQVAAWLQNLVSAGQLGWVAAGATLAVLAVYAASSAISCAIYARRQF